MLLAVAAALSLALLGFTFLLRPQDMPPVAGVTPWQHLEGRKASIYENLRDVLFEFRVGKLSEEDYQRTKTELQAELATVMAEIDQLKATPAASAPVLKGKRAKSEGVQCPHCSARFEKPLKFCGECGKSMGASA
ncbi:MAG: hypothetical protein H7Y20_17855 [Bryobacteraceae bacterium]|nr:hypothetical protein [Bryobacteraceae bacterium]